MKVTLTEFDIAQLYMVISPTDLGKFTPPLRTKLRDAFKELENTPPSEGKYVFSPNALKATSSHPLAVEDTDE